MATKKNSHAFTAEEKSAMKERSAELRSAGSDGAADVRAKIAEMAGTDQTLAAKFHELVHEVAPDLVPRTWYGMPAYATPGRSGKVVCFFQSSGKFKTRYSTIGFSDTAALDEGSMWPITFAIQDWNGVNEMQLRALLEKAVGSAAAG